MWPIYNHSKSILSAFIDALFPPMIRHSDEQTIRSLSALKKQCGHESLLPYRNKAVRQLLVGIKHRQDARCLSLGAALLSEHLKNYHNLHNRNHCITIIPATAIRMQQYRYDHLSCLAALLSEDGDFCIDTTLFQWKHTVRRQNTLSKQERLHNVKHAFSVEKPIMKQTAYVIFDDVTTTGATLKAARQSLLCAGARSVTTLALAR
ncbi:MAG: hypothetical protein OYG31_01100 [Candidatus Kaiserbacteria bacterium]|nr:hypothetical protein [Candidatus Kaiserbacteria bacterium]